MEELRGFTLANLYAKINLADEELVKWLQRLGLLHSNRKCQCGGKMELRSVRAGRSYANWRCSMSTCRKEIGFLKGTFFEGMHLSPKEVIFYF